MNNTLKMTNEKRLQRNQEWMRDIKRNSDELTKKDSYTFYYFYPHTRTSHFLLSSPLLLLTFSCCCRYHSVLCCGLVPGFTLSPHPLPLPRPPRRPHTLPRLWQNKSLTNATPSLHRAGSLCVRPLFPHVATMTRIDREFVTEMLMTQGSHTKHYKV